MERTTTRSSSPPMPTRRSTCWPTPAARRRRSSERSATPAARPSCTPMPGCSRPRRGPGRRGTTSRRRQPTAIMPPVVTYWMNRLQGLDSPEQYLVTLNARDRIDPAKVIAVMDYEHPIYDLEADRGARPAGLAVDAAHRLRRRLSRLGLPRGRLPLGRRGRPQPRGGLVTGPSIAGGGLTHTTTIDDLPVLPAIVDGVVAHRRRGPIRPRVPSPRVPVAGRPRRTPPPAVVPAPGRRLRRPRPPRRHAAADAIATADIKATSNGSWRSVASTSVRAAGSSCSPTRGSSATCSTR